MKPTSSFQRHRPLRTIPYSLGLLAGACLLASVAEAGLFVDLSASAIGGGAYEYAASVSNTGPQDVAIVSLVDAPLNDPLISASLSAPAGFSTSYDPGLGFLDFLADLSFAAGSTVGGFSFQSLAAPGASFSLFEALTVDGDKLTGRVRYPGISVPDSGNSLAALSVGMVVLGAARRRWSAA